MLGRQQRYTYDYVFGPGAAQEDVFDACLPALVDGTFDGFNATVFAYGQTGSGKTHTMMGTSNGMHPGMYILSANDIIE